MRQRTLGKGHHLHPSLLSWFEVFYLNLEQGVYVNLSHSDQDVVGVIANTPSTGIVSSLSFMVIRRVVRMV